MSTKVVYFTFNGILEKAEFSTIDSAMDVKGKHVYILYLHACFFLSLCINRKGLVRTVYLEKDFG